MAKGKNYIKAAELVDEVGEARPMGLVGGDHPGVGGFVSAFLSAVDAFLPEIAQQGMTFARDQLQRREDAGLHVETVNRRVAVEPVGETRGVA